MIENRKLRVFLANKGAVAGLALLAIIFFAALFPSALATHDPLKSVEYNKSRTKAEIQKAVAQAPNQKHYFGTDTEGRDLFSKVVYGSRVSFQVGFISVTISAIFGILLGGLAAMRGGAVDWLIMRGVDVMLAFPSILLALLIVATLGGSLQNVMIAVGISGIPRFARQMRAEVLGLRSKDFVIASRALGATEWRIFFRHILPNSLGPLVVLASLGVASAILEAAGLGFLGLGPPSQIPEWGTMLAENRDHFRRFWWLAVFPGAAIATTVLAFNLVGDGVRDAFDPNSLKNR